MEATSSQAVGKCVVLHCAGRLADSTLRRALVLLSLSVFTAPGCDQSSTPTGTPSSSPSKASAAQGEADRRQVGGGDRQGDGAVDFNSAQAIWDAVPLELRPRGPSDEVRMEKAHAWLAQHLPGKRVRLRAECALSLKRSGPSRAYSGDVYTLGRPVLYEVTRDSKDGFFVGAAFGPLDDDTADRLSGLFANGITEVSISGSVARYQHDRSYVLHLRDASINGIALPNPPDPSTKPIPASGPSPVPPSGVPRKLGDYR